MNTLTYTHPDAPNLIFEINDINENISISVRDIKSGRVSDFVLTNKDNKTKGLDYILTNSQAALVLLTNADEIAIELTNTNAIDYKESSALTTYLHNALAGVRALIEHLEWQRSNDN